MVAGTNPGGQGFIGGKVCQGVNKKEGDLLKDIQVMLFNSNGRPVAYTYTDLEGKFSFKNIAFGTYIVYTEVAGLITIAANVSISHSTPIVENIEVNVGSTAIVTSFSHQLGEDILSIPKLYPNPAVNNLYLQTDLKNGLNTHVKIYNSVGQQIYFQELNLLQGS